MPWRSTETIDISEEFIPALNSINEQLFPKGCKETKIEDIEAIFSDQTKISNDNISQMKRAIGFDPKTVVIQLLTYQETWKAGKIEFKVYKIRPNGMPFISRSAKPYILSRKDGVWTVTV